MLPRLLARLDFGDYAGTVITTNSYRGTGMRLAFGNCTVNAGGYVSTGAAGGNQWYFSLINTNDSIDPYRNQVSAFTMITVFDMPAYAGSATVQRAAHWIRPGDASGDWATAEYIVSYWDCNNAATSIVTAENSNGLSTLDTASYAPNVGNKYCLATQFFAGDSATYVRHILTELVAGFPRRRVSNWITISNLTRVLQNQTDLMWQVGIQGVKTYKIELWQGNRTDVSHLYNV